MESMGHDYENTGAHSLKEESGQIAEQGPTRMVHRVGTSMLIYVNFPSILHPQHLTRDTMKSKAPFEPNMCFYSHEFYTCTYPFILNSHTFYPCKFSDHSTMSLDLKTTDDILYLKLRI